MDIRLLDLEVLMHVVPQTLWLHGTAKRATLLGGGESGLYNERMPVRVWAPITSVPGYNFKTADLKSAHLGCGHTTTSSDSSPPTMQHQTKQEPDAVTLVTTVVTQLFDTLAKSGDNASVTLTAEWKTVGQTGNTEKGTPEINKTMVWIGRDDGELRQKDGKGKGLIQGEQELARETGALLGSLASLHKTKNCCHRRMQERQGQWVHNLPCRRMRTPLGPLQQQLSVTTMEHLLAMRRDSFSAYVSSARREGAEMAEVGVGSDDEGARGRDGIAKGGSALNARVDLHGGEQEVLLPGSVKTKDMCDEGLGCHLFVGVLSLPRFEGVLVLTQPSIDDGSRLGDESKGDGRSSCEPGKMLCNGVRGDSSTDGSNVAIDVGSVDCGTPEINKTTVWIGRANGKLRQEDGKGKVTLAYIQGRNLRKHMEEWHRANPGQIAAPQMMVDTHANYSYAQLLNHLIIKERQKCLDKENRVLENMRQAQYALQTRAQARRAAKAGGPIDEPEQLIRMQRHTKKPYSDRRPWTQPATPGPGTAALTTLKYDQAAFTTHVHRHTACSGHICAPQHDRISGLDLSSGAQPLSTVNSTRNPRARTCVPIGLGLHLSKGATNTAVFCLVFGLAPVHPLIWVLIKARNPEYEHISRLTFRHFGLLVCSHPKYECVGPWEMVMDCSLGSSQYTRAPEAVLQQV
ncbi:hypothetical protein B0H17DRAFT_1138034 [Mycena rosella]|uniref:Uncharacterized protein n=1 Tax=Mycena rosella TaxID=1033263 RepID=A0AAD7D742_MYCRO|nr:hypothetical protein B0H17DRAFT_1138034 [Mycena rosella]